METQQKLIDTSTSSLPTMMSGVSIPRQLAAVGITATALFLSAPLAFMAMWNPIFIVAPLAILTGAAAACVAITGESVWKWIYVVGVPIAAVMFTEMVNSSWG